MVFKRGRNKTGKTGASTELPDHGRDFEDEADELRQRLDDLGEDRDLLARLAQRLSVALEGQDPQLDERLQPLQKALRMAESNAEFRAPAAAVEKDMMHFFQRRDELTQRTLEALRTGLAELGERLPDATAASELDALLESLPQRLETPYEHPAVLEENLRFQRLVLEGQGHVDAKAVDLNGASAPDIPASQLEDDRELICRRVAALLMELVDQLSLPQSEMRRAHRLLERIEKGFSWDSLDDTLQAALELVRAAALGGQAEFESYLHNLNAQLGDIQRFLGESRGDQRSARDSSAQLDEAVRRDVSRMEASLSSATSLEALKVGVRAQLNDIVEAMDSYRHDLKAREARMEERMLTLQERLEAMEEQSERVHAHLEEQRLRALSDPLTLLPNRAAYNDRVRQEHARWARYAGDLSLVVCDLDHFKRINDDYGHLAGDKVLRLVAKIFSKCLRETDFVARYGGEEFVVLMPETPTAEASRVVEKLRLAVAQSPFNFKNTPVKVTLSFGIARFMNQDQPDQVFGRADDALYQAKGRGRNCSVVAPEG